MTASHAAWTPAERDLVALLYPDVHSEDVAALVGRTRRAVYNLAHAMGLHKSADWLNSVSAGRIQRGRQHPNMLANQFKPGLRPWNKGTHYTAGGRSADTRFKPGQSPPTTQPIGSYRIVTNHPHWQQLEQKTSNAKGANHKRWTPVSRLVWEAAHGPAPKGSIVVFKPGMKTLTLEHITLDRLDCITRKVHAQRNHPASKSPELAKLVQLKGAITRQVNRIQREADQAQRVN